MITIVLAGCPFSLGIKIFIIDFIVIEGYIYKTVHAFGKKKKKEGKKLAISSEAVKEKAYRDYGLCLLFAPGYLHRSIQN